MPYIKRSQIDYITAEVKDNNAILPNEISNAGELNYAFSEIISTYFLNKSNYQAINDIIGALEGAKLEFQRRVVAPYEDRKIKENGDLEAYDVLNPKDLEEYDVLLPEK